MAEKETKTYKTGEAPKKGDVVMGVVGGAPARGRVLRVSEAGACLLERRAPYEGPRAPKKVKHDEIPAAELSLVYRHEAHSAPAAVAAVPSVQPKRRGRKA